jgi:hypothetical protein
VVKLEDKFCGEVMQSSPVRAFADGVNIEKLIKTPIKNPNCLIVFLKFKSD